MAINSHLSVSSMVASVSGRVRGRFPLRVFLASVIAMGFAPVAWSDIYRWTDKDGHVNFSDVAPPEEQRIKDVVVVTRSRPPVPAEVAQRELLARIQSLEQQVQAQRNAPPPTVAASPSPAIHAAPAPLTQQYVQTPPVQPAIYYDGGYANGAYADTLQPPYLYSVVPVYVTSFVRTHPGRAGFGSRVTGRGPIHGVPGGPRRGVRPPGRR